ncbi:MAG: DUF3426 domain-containing protein [Hydrogenophaga sp.]|uniref:DUF3426 domain-containing protein n=1 Tax=Hydrogenophaga sp. TaxID=1904254 RepID=UPI003D1024F7
MSFTTRCPACGTMFRVVADQLKISEGWVRCGHCADVFDATLYLQPWTAPGSATESDSPGQDAPAPEYDLDAEPETAIMEDSEMSGEWAELEGSHRFQDASEELAPPPLAQAPQATDADDDTDDSEVSDFHTDLQRFAAGVGRTGDPEFDDSSNGIAAEVSAAAEAARGAPSTNAGPSGFEGSGLDDPEAVPGFVRQARRRAFWSSRGMRASLALLALLLGVLLIGQLALHERDRLAAARPDLQPLLQRACDALGCRLAPVRRIDAIVIDSTALVRRLGDFYSFDLVLKNTASMPLALPALELSLTDTRDQVIARRVFLPEEWPDAPSLLPAQGSVSVSLRLSLSLGDASPMAGYRALVFYP